MGDAGPPTSLPVEHLTRSIHQHHVRDIHVLVTGFGPFKSFSINPSWLIASALPTRLDPLPPKEPSESQAQAPQYTNPLTSLFRRVSGHSQDPTEPKQPLRPTNTTPYSIHIHTYPAPLRVAYDPTSVTIPSLLSPETNTTRIDYDFVFHIGLASGRDSYTLETTGYRDGYGIPDVDEQTGYLAGEKTWKDLDVPARLDVGWDAADVLERWVDEVERRNERDAQEESDHRQQQQQQRQDSSFVTRHGIMGLRAQAPTHTQAQAASEPRPPPRRAVVKLSRDAGRFLCEFILMCSLVYRYLQADTSAKEKEKEKVGKVAFLHVPNGIEEADVARGVMVAGSAIRSVVASWEEGWRNPAVYETVEGGFVARQKEREMSRRVSGVSGEGPVFETMGTGDS